MNKTSPLTQVKERNGGKRKPSGMTPDTAITLIGYAAIALGALTLIVVFVT